MTQYNTLNVKLCNSQLDKLKSAIKNGTEVTLNLSSNFIGNSNVETNFPHKLLLTDTQISKICKAFENGSSANIKFSKTQLSKIVQLSGFVTGMTGIVKPENEIFKTANGLLSLPNSIAKKSASMANKGTLVNAGLRLLGEKIKKKNYGSGMTRTNN